MEFDSRFAITLFLGAMWLYFLNVIRTMTVEAPADPALFFLAVLHFIVLFYLCFAMYSLYATAISHITRTNHKLRGAEIVEKLLFSTWPVVIVGAVVTYLSMRINLGRPDQLFLLIFYVGGFMVATTMYFAIYRGDPILKSLKLNWIAILLFFVGLPLVGVFSVIVVSPFLADVQIRTDKAIYLATDSVTFSVTPAGYVFRPTITKITCGAFDENTAGTYTVDSNLLHGSPYIAVEFQSQVIPFSLQRFHELKMVRH